MQGMKIEGMEHMYVYLLCIFYQLHVLRYHLKIGQPLAKVKILKY